MVKIGFEVVKISFEMVKIGFEVVQVQFYNFNFTISDIHINQFLEFFQMGYFYIPYFCQHQLIKCRNCRHPNNQAYLRIRRIDFQC